MTDPLAIELPDELVDRIAERVAELLSSGHDAQADPEPWIGVADAAAHLACPLSRLYALTSARRVPFQKDGSRLLFRRSDLDHWIANGGAKRP